MAVTTSWYMETVLQVRYEQVQLVGMKWHCGTKMWCGVGTPVVNTLRTGYLNCLNARSWGF
jgi:hypothetical protein